MTPFRRVVAAALVAIPFCCVAILFVHPQPAAAELITCPDTPVIHQACSAATALPNATADAATSVAGDAVAGIFDQLTKWVVDGAKDLVGRLGAAVDAGTRPDVQAPWFTPSYRLMVSVGVAFLVPMVVLAALHAVVRQDFGGLAKAVGVKLPVAAIGMVAAVQVVDLLVSITDNLSGYVGSTIGGSGEKFATGLVHLMEGALVGGPGVAAFLAFLVALAVAFFALVLWVELVVRQAAVVVATLFLPLGFAALVWPSTGRWLRRLAEGLIAFILSKFVITAIVAVAAAGLASGSDGLSGVILGAGILLVATFTPYVLLKVIPIGELALVAGLEGLSRRPLAATNSALSTVYWGKALFGDSGGAPAGATASANGSGGVTASDYSASAPSVTTGVGAGSSGPSAPGAASGSAAAGGAAVPVVAAGVAAERVVHTSGAAARSGIEATGAARPRSDSRNGDGD